MPSSELAQLELLAQVDSVLDRLMDWVEGASDWQELQTARGVLKRLLSRVDSLRLRLDAPLVIATFGGTGVGKSSLVNALFGEELATVGRQRPTTTQPTLIVHRDTPLEAYGFPLDELRVVRRESRLLRDWLIVDCPDPDTSESDDLGTNLNRLHRIIPFCDVLLYVSTQQKYRSAKVGQELAEAAAGCKLIFVQTHADRDADIRADWRAQLSASFQVADMFFLDSRRAFAEQQQGLRPTGDFGRLLDALLQELSSTQRIRIRQGNLFGLLSEAIDDTLSRLQETQQHVRQLEATIQRQSAELTAELSNRLRDDLLQSRGIWERRLLGEISQRWGLSPFSLMLRAWHGQASLLASLTIMRARSSAQMAVWGAVHGARWLATRQQQSQAEQQLQQSAALEVSAADLQRAQLIVAGDARQAGLLREKLATATDQLPQSAAIAEDEFWTIARTRLDREITEVVRWHSRAGWRGIYELSFALLPVWLLYRIGKNFFYDSWWRGEPLLETSFYIPALLFLVLWIGLFLLLFTARLRRGMERRVQELAESVATIRLSGGLFPGVASSCREYHDDVAQLEDLASIVHQLRDQVAETPGLSHSRSVPAPRLSDNS